MKVKPNLQVYLDRLPLHFSKIVDKYDPQASVSLFPDKLSISKRANSTGHSQICEYQKYISYCLIYLDNCSLKEK